MLKWIDRIPVLPLAMIAIVLGLAPFQPEPHLVEKTRMLFQGELVRALDIFDLVFHAAPALLLIVRLFRAGVKT